MNTQNDKGNGKKTVLRIFDNVVFTFMLTGFAVGINIWIEGLNPVTVYLAFFWMLAGFALGVGAAMDEKLKVGLLFLAVLAIIVFLPYIIANFPLAVATASGTYIAMIWFKKPK